jgi:hypothetical protein
MKSFLAKPAHYDDDSLLLHPPEKITGLPLEIIHLSFHLFLDTLQDAKKISITVGLS